MNDWHSGFVETNGIRLHYTRTGGERPALVLAHGATDDGLCWAPVARALASDYDVVMVDARGHGRSEAPPDGYDPAAQAANFLGLIRALDLDRPAILGHSMGAGTALVLASMEPDVPRAILLEDPGPWWTGWPSMAHEQAELVQIGERQREYQRSTREALIAGRRSKYPAWQIGDVEPWADAKLRVSEEAFQVFAPTTWTSVGWPAVLGGITCPGAAHHHRSGDGRNHDI